MYICMHTYIVVVIVCVTKIVTTYAQVNLTETRGSVHSRILWNVFQVYVFRCATGTGTKSFIHFPVLPLYNVLIAKSVGMILTPDLWREITWSPRLMNMSTLFSTICRKCGATIYGHKVLIKTLSSNPLNNSFLSAQAAQAYYVGFWG